jgi:hypothetical protein
MQHVQVAGLMCMAREGASEAEARHTFARAREIFEEMRFRKIAGPAMRHLSMGMTDDFEWGIAEGSTLVRIGSAIFGPRPRTTEDVDED